MTQFACAAYSYITLNLIKEYEVNNVQHYEPDGFSGQFTIQILIELKK